MEQPKTEQWTFSADRVVGDHKSEYMEAFGNCTLSMGENQLRADFARYYQSTGWVFVKGNVRAHWGGDFLQADEGEFDLKNMTGWLKNGQLFMAKPHIYVKAEHVEKTAGDTYRFKNAKVTACDGEQPAWSVTTEEGDVQLDGRVRLYRSAFRIKDTPVFYWPYMSLPGRKKRQSGFLFPSIGSSKKLGFRMNLPYYWAINEESDATFYQNYMSRRGYQQGFEFRHTEDEESKGIWMLDAMKDKKRAVTEDEEWKDYRKDGLTRPNRSRWWARGMYDGWLGSPQLQVKVDLDLVSDQNYLRDFETGPNGYNQTRDQLVDTFGRDIASKDSLLRTSTAFASRSWERYGVTGKIQYVQNLAYMNGNGDDNENTTVQTLPELNGFAFQQSVFGTPLEALAGVKYDYFTRNKGHTGHRLRATPEIKLPISNEYFTFIPSAGADITAYSLTRHEGYGDQTIIDTSGRTEVIDTSETKSGKQTRTALTAGFTAFSEMTRTFSLDAPLKAEPSLAGTSRWTRLKHSIIPRVRYSYLPTITGQQDLPYFDRYDRLQGRNLVTYSLTNVLDRRRERVVLSPGSNEGPQASVETDYLDFMLFRLEQSYDYNEASRKDSLDEYERRPFGDIMAELRIKPETFIDLISRTWFSPYSAGVTQHNNSVRFYKDGLGEVSVGYNYLVKVDEYLRQRDKTMSIADIGLKWEVNDSFTLGAKYRHDFNSERDLERTISLDWAAQCYVMHFSFSQRENDERFEFGFELFNF